MANLAALPLDIDQATNWTFSAKCPLRFSQLGEWAVRQPEWDIVRALPRFCNVSKENFNELATAGGIVLHDMADLLNEPRAQELYPGM